MKYLIFSILLAMSFVAESREMFAEFAGSGQDIRIIDNKIVKGDDGFSGTYKFIMGDDSVDVYFKHRTETEYSPVYKGCQVSGKSIFCMDSGELCSAVGIFTLFKEDRALGFQQSRSCNGKTIFNSLVQEIGRIK